MLQEQIIKQAERVDDNYNFIVCTLNFRGNYNVKINNVIIARFDSKVSAKKLFNRLVIENNLMLKEGETK